MTLELRKAALEADGWAAVRGNDCGRMNDYFYLRTPSGEIKPSSGYWSTALEAFTLAPAVEWNAGISEPWFLEWCEKNGYLWSMMSMNTGFTLTVTIGFKVRIADVWGATLSEARAKAVIAASKVKPNATTPEAQI